MFPILKIILFSAVAVVYLFIFSKLLGKKQIAKLDVLDYLLGISVSAIAAEMAFDSSDKPIYHYLIAMSVFLVVHLLVAFVERKGRFFKVFFKGKPQTIIYEGKIDYKQLKKSKLDINDIIAKCREKGYFDLSDIAYVIFENSGELSIMPKGEKKPVVVSDLGICPQKASLPFYLIDDGHISFSSLRTLGKDKEWLLKRLKLDEDDLKNIILAVYDNDKDEIIVSTKF